jgi:serine/threonine protein kinase
MRDLIRQVVGGYKSLKLEGQDQGYVLFSGEDPETHQPVSIKVLPRLLGDDPQIAAQFRKLSQAIRQLNHPNIAASPDVGEKSGLPYIVTRAIEKAQPLAAKLDQPWAVDAAADLVMQTGQALEHAYKKGIVHGSLTPDNIEVRDDGRVAVTDFGLSEMLDLVGAQVRKLGSPYLAPERQAGSRADSRADVYSLAAILYSLLTKRPPQVVKGEVLPPSRFNPDVPAEMDTVVVKALARDPAARYPNIKAFLAAFGAVSLAPIAEKVWPVTPGQRCSRCGAENQTGRFCRKCGAKLARRKPTAAPPPPSQSRLDEPIQITRIDVGQIAVGKGIDVQPTTIAQPMMVATGEMEADFPAPLPMPEIDTGDLWPTSQGASLIAMPEPPPMPNIDWAEVAPPMPEVPSIEDTGLQTKREGD